MVSATSDRGHSTAVAAMTMATVVAVIAVCCATAAVVPDGGSSPANTAPPGQFSILAKLPSLPKFPYQLQPQQPYQQKPQPPSQKKPQPPSQKKPQPPSQQKPRPPLQQKPRPPSQKKSPDQSPQQLQPTQTTTAKSTANVTKMTSPIPYTLETTTHDRSIITVPLKACPEGQRMGPDRNCRPEFSDPEGDQA